MATGFYRVLEIHNNNNRYYKYKINNKLLRKEIVRRDILELKHEVEKAGLLWGITNISEAMRHIGNHDIYFLQGRYGIHVNFEG